MPIREADKHHQTLKFYLLKSGFPIRRSADQRVLSPPHGLSQSATSFIASQRQGIHQMPLPKRLPANQTHPCPEPRSGKPEPARQNSIQDHEHALQHATQTRRTAGTDPKIATSPVPPDPCACRIRLVYQDLVERTCSSTPARTIARPRRTAKTVRSIIPIHNVNKPGFFKSQETRDDASPMHLLSADFRLACFRLASARSVNSSKGWWA